MYKLIVKLSLNINEKVLIILTIISGLISSVNFVPKFVKPFYKIYPQLNNEKVKNVISLVTDFDVLNRELKYLIYISISIFILCLLIWVIRYKYNNKNITDKIIIGHSSMSQVQFNVETDGEYQVKEINLIDDMNNTVSEYEKIKYAVSKQDRLVEDFKRNIENKYEYGYMGVAHTPLILRMGNQIGDELYITLFHKYRTGNTKDFKELDENKDFKKIYISKSVLDKDSNELIVGLSTTSKITDGELNIFNPNDKNILIFSSEELGKDVITSKNQVEYYVQYIKSNIEKIIKEININKIHMVLSTSVAMTFALGQSISLNNDPNIIIYHYDRNDIRKYTWGIDLSKESQDCVVLTNNLCKIDN